MMMQRRHTEDTSPGELEAGDLNDHRNRFEHKQTANNRQHQLMLGDDADRTEGAADCQ